MAKGEKSSSGEYETFDSGSGPLIPKKDEGHYDNRDSNLHSDGDSGQDKNLGVPNVPMK